MKFTAKLKESERQINAIIAAEVNKAFKGIVNRAQPIIVNEIRVLFKEAVESSPEYQSLLFGKLMTEFGIEDSARKLSDIMKVWLNNINTSYNTKSGVLTINMCLADFSDVLGLEAASLITEKGRELEWLQWLLLDGDKTIIRDFHIEYNPGYSRTGSDIMVKGGSWKVPSEFSGSMGDNFVTRALDTISDETISNIIQNQLRKAYK